MRGNIQEEIGNIQEEINSIQEEIGNIQEEIGNIQEEIGNIQEEIDSIQEEIESIQEEMDSIQKIGIMQKIMYIYTGQIVLHTIQEMVYLSILIDLPIPSIVYRLLVYVLKPALFL